MQQKDSGEEEELTVSFFANEGFEVGNNDLTDLVVDSGCTNYMIKDRKLVAALNGEIERVVECSNKTKSKLWGRCRAVFGVKDTEGNAVSVELRDAPYVPAYARREQDVSARAVSSTLWRRMFRRQKIHRNVSSYIQLLLYRRNVLEIIFVVLFLYFFITKLKLCNSEYGKWQGTDFRF